MKKKCCQVYYLSLPMSPGQTTNPLPSLVVKSLPHIPTNSLPRWWWWRLDSLWVFRIVYHLSRWKLGLLCLLWALFWVAMSVLLGVNARWLLNVTKGLGTPSPHAHTHTLELNIWGDHLFLFFCPVPGMDLNPLKEQILFCVTFLSDKRGTR